MAPWSTGGSSLGKLASHGAKAFANADKPNEVVEKTGTVGLNQPFIDARFRNFYVLFNSFKVTDWKELLAALLIVFIFAVVATIVFHVLKYFERDVLERRERMTALERLAAGSSFACRMTLLYVAVWFAMLRNLWVFMALICGHLVGWVILSGQHDMLSAARGPRLELVGKKHKEEQDSEDGSDCDSV